ncbi:MAG: hypothetical protein JXA93_01455 [Anaerolineae bacterium]|nr:hypothetical protein [Anaerolineae bacterium]
MDILLIIAASLLVLGAGALAILRLAGLRARRRFEAHVDACHARLAAAEQRLGGVEARAETYPPDLPAPFAPLRAVLDRALAHARAGAAEAHARRRALLHGAGQPRSSMRFTHALPLLLLFDEPRRWRRLDADAGDVETALAELEAGVEAAAAALARLEGVPADTAAACASLANTARQVAALVDELAGRGAHGAALDLASSVAHDLAGRLGVACTTTPRDTVAAFELFEILSVPVAEVHAQLSAWAEEAHRLDQAIADARHALDDAHQRLGALPPAVDGAEMAHRFEALRHALPPLDQEAAHPDVRALASLAARARDLIDAASILADDADRAVHKQIEFAAHHRRARTTLARAELEMQAAAGEVIYPLDWREWSGRCAAAQRALALIGNAAAPRTPEALETDGAVAARLAAEAERLMKVVGQARTQREALRRLLQQPALAPDRPWEARAAALHDAASAYAPQNWPAADRVPHLRADAATLADQHARWVPREPWQPLAVDTLDRRLDAVARLAGALQAFEPTLARIEEALAALRAAETEAREQLAGCCSDLAHLVDLLRGAQPPFDRPVTRHLGSLRQLIHQAEALEASFSRRDRGTVAGKVERANRWARAARAHLKPVCRGLDTAASAGRAALSAELAALTQVVRLDAEPAVRTAAAHAAAPRPARHKVRGAPWARTAADIAYAVALAADCRASDQASRELAAAIGSLPELLETWRMARDEAQAAWDHLETARQALTDGWPPLACDAGQPGRLRDTARRARDEACREEEHHLATASRVHQAAARLNSLAQAWRRAAAAATEATVAARQAHARVQAAAGLLDAARARAPSSEVDHEIDRLRRSWSRRPPTEEQAIGEIERLHHRLSPQI